MGPKIEPWGMPLWIGAFFDNAVSESNCYSYSEILEQLPINVDDSSSEKERFESM